MKLRRVSVLTASVVLASLVLSTVDLSAQQQARRGRGLWGDWRVKMEFNGNEWESILAFSRDENGNRTGQWISWFGATDLKDITYEDGKLSFTQTRRNRDGDTMTSKFTGSISEGKLTGKLSSERGDTPVTGERSARLPRVAGNWETTFNIGDRQITNTLILKADKDGRLAVDWQSDRVKHKITDVVYERGKLTFKTNSTMEDREWQSNFEGTFDRDSYTGLLKSDQGEREVKGKRVGGEVIGTWNLELSSDRGDRKQRLRIFPDMSALYGVAEIKKIDFEDGRISFKVSRTFGDRTFETSFQGKVEGDKLTGEITTSFGNQKVTGKKAPPRARRGGQRGAN